MFFISLKSLLLILQFSVVMSLEPETVIALYSIRKSQVTFIWLSYGYQQTL